MTEKKLNAIDIGVIVIIAIVIIAAAILLLPKKSTDSSASDGKNASTQTVVLEVKKKTETFCNAVQVGDEVKDPSNMKKIGKIVSIDRVPSTAYTVSPEDASFVVATVPDNYDMYVTVELNGVKDTKRIGTSLSIRGKKYICQGYIVDIIKGKENTK